MKTVRTSVSEGKVPLINPAFQRGDHTDAQTSSETVSTVLPAVHHGQTVKGGSLILALKRRINEKGLTVGQLLTSDY